jgi:hypothetical protein
MRTTVSINIESNLQLFRPELMLFGPLAALVSVCQIRPDQLWVGPKPISSSPTRHIDGSGRLGLFLFLGFLTLDWRFLAWIRP